MTSPNVIFIVLDTLRRDHLSLYGYPIVTSPALDAFAAKGTVFDRAIAPAQWTIPSHASMFTGLYPNEHQVIEASSTLSGKHPTLAEIFAIEGYETAAFCNNPLLGILNTNLQRGFSVFYNYAGAAPNRPSDLSKSAIQRAFSERFRRIAQTVSNQFAQSDWLFRVSINPIFTPVWTRFINYKGDTERSITDFTHYLDAYQQNQQEQPLFAFLNLMGTHLPYRPPQAIINQLEPEFRNNQAAYRFMSEFNGNATRWASPPEQPFADWQEHAMRVFYDAEIMHQDQQLQKLFAYLEQAGWLKDSVVVVLADHGESHGDHGLFGHGFGAYQELVHVPLIIHAPEHLPGGGRISENISTRRIFHTLLDIAGIAPPLAEDDPNANVTTLSMKQVHNQTHAEYDMAFTEAFPPQTFLQVLQHRAPETIDRLQLTLVRRAIYHQQHKLLLRDNQTEALFNVQQDPLEQTNLREEQPQTSDLLRTLISPLIRDIDANGENQVTPDTVSPEVVENLRALGYID